MKYFITSLRKKSNFGIFPFGSQPDEEIEYTYMANSIDDMNKHIEDIDRVGHRITRIIQGEEVKFEQRTAVILKEKKKYILRCSKCMHILDHENDIDSLGEFCNQELPAGKCDGFITLVQASGDSYKAITISSHGVIGKREGMTLATGKKIVNSDKEIYE